MKSSVWRAVALLVAAGAAAVAHAAVSRDCDPYDVVIMIDSTMSSSDFANSVSIGRAIADQFDIGGSDRVTAFSFGKGIFQKKNLWQIDDADALNKQFDKMRRRTTVVNLQFAFKVANNMITARRRQATEIIVMISDGKMDSVPYSNAQVKRICPNIGGKGQYTTENWEECMELLVEEAVEDDGVKVIYIPVGDDPFIPDASTDPLADLLDIPEDRSSTEAIVESVSDAACKTKEETCTDGLDIIFVVDASNNLNDGNFEDVHEFVVDMAARFTANTGGNTRYGLVEYSATVDQEFTLLDASGQPRFTQQGFAAAVQGISRSSGVTKNVNTPLALKTTLQMIGDTQSLDIQEGRDLRTTLVVHVGDNVPYLKFDTDNKLPSECKNFDRSGKYPKVAPKTCTTMFAQSIQKESLVSFIPFRVGTKRGSASLYRSVRPNVQTFQASTYAALDSLVNDMVDEHCPPGIVGTTESPTGFPTDAPTDAPTQFPTPEPTDAPTDAPTQFPTLEPTDAPTDAPTQFPTPEPTDAPTDAPTQFPTPEPTLSPVDILPGCYLARTSFNSSDVEKRFNDDPAVQTAEQCHSKCTERANCRYWTHRDPDPDNNRPSALCVLMSDYDSEVSRGSRYTSGPRECTEAPTPSPTLAPTLSPVDFVEGCYEQETYKRPGDSSNRVATFNDDPSVQAPEQCHSLCVDSSECIYWAFRAARDGSDNNDVALCLLLRDFESETSSARWTSGPKLCTEAPTPSPTDTPTLSPVDVSEDCYLTNTNFNNTNDQKVDSFRDDANIQSPEQCHSKCTEFAECNYWSFRAARSGSGTASLSLCTLLSDYENTLDKNGRFTVGPRDCE